MLGLGSERVSCYFIRSQLLRGRISRWGSLVCCPETLFVHDMSESLTGTENIRLQLRWVCGMVPPDEPFKSSWFLQS